MQLFSAVPEQHFNYVVQTNLAPFHLTDNSFQKRSLGLHQSVNITKFGQHFDTGSSLDPAVSILVLNLSKLWKHKLMSFEKCTSGQQSRNLSVIVYLVRSNMSLVSNHMPFQKVEPSTGHSGWFHF